MRATPSSPPPSRRCKTELSMALTEEFIRMKVNGDASSTTADTVSPNTDDSVNSNREVSISERASITNVEGTNVGDRGITGRGSTIDTRGKPPSDKLGYFALSNVQTLARSAGIGSLDGDGGLGQFSLGLVFAWLFVSSFFEFYAPNFCCI